MATGFEKFSRSVLSEAPIKINKPAESEGYAAHEEEDDDGRDRAEVHEPESAYGRTSLAVSPRRRTAADEPKAKRASSRKSGSRSMVGFMVQISPETKTKLDEMKFRLKMNYWEIVDEAIGDLYDKYYKK